MAVHWVVVLGDFGRSPRMQYHTLSLSGLPDTEVYVVAYDGSEPLLQLKQAPNVHLAYVPKPPAWSARLPRVLGLAAKVLHQICALLLLLLLRLPAPATILMQNPPAIPTMALLWLVALCRRAQLVIDWHNYGYTIMQLSYGERHPLVRLARAYELFWGRRGHRHFCVTAAMQQHLSEAFGVHGALVLHDRPPERFRPISLEEKHALLARLEPSIRAAAVGAPLPAPGGGPGGQQTLLTQLGRGGRPEPRPARPAVVVSSTSWTPDEDFGLLLEAAQRYDRRRAAGGGGLPHLLVVITGRGPQREAYLQRAAGMAFSGVTFCSVWLEAEDYPLLLAAADLGVCLHTSSSGLDLPMKVVDMFGCALPVCAVRYACIGELVREGQNGLLFGGAEQLAEQLEELLRGFPGEPSGGLQRLQQGVRREQQLRWDRNWEEVAAPVFRGAARAGAGGAAASRGAGGAAVVARGKPKAARAPR
jgi:beta-1,4-mannosyltransferase